MDTFTSPDTKALSGAVQLTHLGLISAQGVDAASFLHGQLSQDIKGMDSGVARLAAFCSAKGRMLASFLVIKAPNDTLHLITDAQVLPAALKRLSMFVMRAKAKLVDDSAQLHIVGLTGSVAEKFLASKPDMEPWQVIFDQPNMTHIVKLPQAAGVARCLWIGPAHQSAALIDTATALPLSTWQWLEVMSGVVSIELPTVDQFVPQMVNYELVGGVNFKKGCYPGQEVVARSQYRGTLKRRTFLLHGKQPMQTGQEVFSSTDPSQPAGLIANAAPMPKSLEAEEQSYSALVELKWQVLNEGWLLGSPQGPQLTLGQMPYEVPLGAEAD